MKFARSAQLAAMVAVWALTGCSKPQPSGGQAPANPGASVTAPVPPKNPAEPSVELSALDPSVSPCEDLYLHACGGWLAQAKVPAGRTWVDRAGERISDRRRELLRRLLETGAGSPELNVPRAALAECKDQDKLDGAGLVAFAELVRAIDSSTDADGFANSLALLHQVGVNAGFRLSVGPVSAPRAQPAATPAASGEPIDLAYAFWVAPPPLGLALRDYEQRAARAAYQNRIGRGLALYYSAAASADAPTARGDDLDLQIRKESLAIVALEAALARAILNTAPLRTGQLSQLNTATLPRQRRINWEMYLARRLAVRLLPGQRASASTDSAAPSPAASHTVPSLREPASAVPAPAPLGACPGPSDCQLYETRPGWLGHAAKALAAAPPEHLRAYLRWRLLSDASLALPTNLRPETDSLIPGETRPRARRDLCLDWLEDRFTPEVNHSFASAALTQQAARRARDISEQISAAFRPMLEAATWLDAESRERALAQLSSVQFQLGAGAAEEPLLVTPGAGFAKLWLQTQRAVDARQLSRLGSAVNRQRMPIRASTPNMFYHPRLRVVIAPAGYLLPPNFDARASDSAMYSRAGFGLAHELTHAFDQPMPRASAWGWTPSARASFDERVRCVTDELASLDQDTGFPGAGSASARLAATSNSPRIRQLVAESIADVGGLKAAYAAFRTAQAELAAPQPSSAPRAAPPAGRVSQADRAERAASSHSREQQFWLSFAQSQCRKLTPAGAEWLKQNDTHLGSHARVNFTARSVPELAQDFECASGAPMAVPAACSVW